LQQDSPVAIAGEDSAYGSRWHVLCCDVRVHLFWLLAAWLSPGSPLLCGEASSLRAEIDAHGVAVLALYSYTDPRAAEVVDGAFAAQGLKVWRRMHSGGYLPGSVIVTRETIAQTLTALFVLGLCPLGLSVVPVTLLERAR
jgi:hypothetical protein